MRKIIITVSIFISCIINIFPQWSTDPNNNLIVGYGQDPKICSDSAGGCYITYTYETTWYPQKLALERLDRYGYKPWGTLKQILGELPEQWQAEIVEDEEGGIIVSYQDNEWIPPSYYNSKVRVQKVDSVGNFLWGQTGVRVSLETVNHSGQHLVSDGDGGCIIIWGDWDGPVRINRINRLGQRVWGETGIQLASNHTNLSIVKVNDYKFYVQVDTIVFRINQDGEIINQYNTTLGQIVPDSEGGLVLSNKVWTGMIPKLVSQRIDSLGNNLWQEPYVEISDSLYINSQLEIQYNDGYYFYGWSGTKNGINNVGQFQVLREDGSKLFLGGSISISENSPIGPPIIVPSEFGRTILIWNDATIVSTTIAQLYDTLGNKLWDENGVIVSYPAIAVETTTDGQGGFITMGPINQFTIVVQQVNKNGKLGEIITSIELENDYSTHSQVTLFQNYPNPFNSTTSIKYQVQKEGRIRIVLYNILGEVLRTLSDEYKTIGTHSLTFNSNGLPSGVYLYTLETGSELLVKKLIILK